MIASLAGSTVVRKDGRGINCSPPIDMDFIMPQTADLQINGGVGKISIENTIGKIKAKTVSEGRYF